MDEVIAMIGAAIFLGGFIFFIIAATGSGIKSIYRTTKAIGKWNDKQLKDK